MTTTLSSKGQVVLPKQARQRLRLRPGVKLVCAVRGDSLVLTPEHPAAELPRLVQDPESGLRITKSPAGTQVTNQDVRAALLDLLPPHRRFALSWFRTTSVRRICRRS